MYELPNMWDLWKYPDFFTLFLWVYCLVMLVMFVVGLKKRTLSFVLMFLGVTFLPVFLALAHNCLLMAVGIGEIARNPTVNASDLVAGAYIQYAQSFIIYAVSFVFLLGAIILLAISKKAGREIFNGEK